MRIKIMTSALAICLAGSAGAGLVVHYALDGDWQDSAGTNHLTPTGGNLPSFGPGAPGLGQAAYFDGENYAERLVSTGLPNDAADPWSISCWLFVSAIPTEGIDPYMVLGGGWTEQRGGSVPGSKRYPFAYIIANGIKSYFGGGTVGGVDTTINPATPLLINEWQMLTFTYDGSTGRRVDITGPSDKWLQRCFAKSS